MSIWETASLTRSALRTQTRVILALVMRDLVAEVASSRLSIFWLLIRPAMLIGIFYILFTIQPRLMPQGMPLFAFLATGWLAWFNFMRSFRDMRKSGSGSLLMFPHMTQLDIVLANGIVEWFIYTFVFAFFVFLAIVLEHTPLPADPLRVILGYWAVGWIGCLLGTIFMGLGRVLPFMSYLVMPVRRLGHMFTGVVVTAADTPNVILKYMTWNPLFHAIEIMREAWWPAYVSPIADGWYVIRCLFFMAVVGLIIERATRKFDRE